MIGEVLEVMADLAEGGMTVVVAAHETGFARRVADRVVFMGEGRIVEVEQPEHFFENSENEWIKRFLDRILHRVQPRAQECGILTRTRFECAFH